LLKGRIPVVHVPLHARLHRGVLAAILKTVGLSAEELKALLASPSPFGEQESESSIREIVPVPAAEPSGE
jgi:hypothetical protein